MMYEFDATFNNYEVYIIIMWYGDENAVSNCIIYTTVEGRTGEQPTSYLVYTTGTGFPPHIESIPHAMKGIATVFMLALLTGIYTKWFLFCVNVGY